MRRTGYLACAVAVLAILFWATNSIPSVRAEGPWGEGLVGTWVITATPDAQSQAPPFTELMKFDRGSGLTETNGIFNANSALLVPPPINLNASDGYGTWKMTGQRNEFATTFKKLMFAGPSGIPELHIPPDAQIGVATITEVLTLSEQDGVQSISGPFHINVNVGGNLIFAADGSVASQRLAVEPLGN